MKRYWGWILACVAVLYLLWSLGLQASINPATSVDQHLVAAPRPSRSLSSYRGQGFLSRRWTRTRAGPLESFFPPDVLLRVEDLDSVGPPWLESRRTACAWLSAGAPLVMSSRPSSARAAQTFRQSQRSVGGRTSMPRD